jgi:hypothetical protein
MSGLGPDMSGFGGFIWQSSQICPAYPEISFSPLILGHKGHLNTSNKFPMRFFPNPQIFFPILDELEEPRF